MKILDDSPAKRLTCADKGDTVSSAMDDHRSYPRKHRSPRAAGDIPFLHGLVHCTDVPRGFLFCEVTP